MGWDSNSDLSPRLTVNRVGKSSTSREMGQEHTLRSPVGFPYSATAPRPSLKRKHGRQSRLSDPCCGKDRLSRGPQRAFKLKRSSKKRKEGGKGFTHILSHIWMQFSVALSFVIVSGLKCRPSRVWVGVPKRETFLKFPKLCKHTMGRFVNRDSTRSRAFGRKRVKVDISFLYISNTAYSMYE
jgi:hypothetical protein